MVGGTMYESIYSLKLQNGIFYYAKEVTGHQRLNSQHSFGG